MISCALRTVVIYEINFFIICSSAKESFNFLVKYLETFADEDIVTLNEAKEEAVRAVIEFVKAADMFQVIKLIVSEARLKVILIVYCHS